MTSFRNRERGVSVEDVVCERWPFEPAAPAGDGGRGHDWFRQLPWSTVFDSLEDPRGGSA